MRKLLIALSLVLVTTQARAQDASLYQLDMPLIDDHGQTIRLDTFRGHPVIVSMFYGTCPAACPMLIERIHAVEARLDPKARADVRVLLVSFDPERDTPARLDQLAEAHHLDRARWTLAAASKEDATTLGAVLGIHFKRIEDGYFDHDSKLVLLDADGVIRARLDAFDVEPSRVAEKLVAAK